MWKRQGRWASSLDRRFFADFIIALGIDGEINQVDRVSVAERHVASSFDADASSLLARRVEELLECSLARLCVVQVLFLQNEQHRHSRKVENLF
jgi:hypothetical protein